MRRGKCLEVVAEGHPFLTVPRAIPPELDIIDARTHAPGAEFDRVCSQPGEDTRKNHRRQDPRPIVSAARQGRRESHHPGGEKERKIPVAGKQARHVLESAAGTLAHGARNGIIPQGETGRRQRGEQHGKDAGPDDIATIAGNHRQDMREAPRDFTSKTPPLSAARVPRSSRLPRDGSPPSPRPKRMKRPRGQPARHRGPAL